MKKAPSLLCSILVMGICTKSLILFSLSVPGAASLGVPVLHSVLARAFHHPLLPAWAASERSDGVTWGFLSHHDVGWALPVSGKEGFTLKSLLVYVLLSKHVTGPHFVAVLLCWISSFLAWCVRALVDSQH